MGSSLWVGFRSHDLLKSNWLVDIRLTWSLPPRPAFSCFPCIASVDEDSCNFFVFVLKILCFLHHFSTNGIAPPLPIWTHTSHNPSVQSEELLRYVLLVEIWPFDTKYLVWEKCFHLSGSKPISLCCFCFGQCCSLSTSNFTVTLDDFWPSKVPLDNIYIEAFLYMTPVWLLIFLP